MRDVPVQKINVIIEVELREQPLPRSSAGDPTSDMESHGYEQALFAALQADPARYAAFIRLLALGSVEAYGIHRLLAGLAQVHDTHTASMRVLESLLPLFSRPAQAYLHQAITDGSIMESTTSLFTRLQVDPVCLRIDYPAPPAS